MPSEKGSGNEECLAGVKKMKEGDGDMQAAAVRVLTNMRLVYRHTLQGGLALVIEGSRIRKVFDVKELNSYVSDQVGKGVEVIVDNCQNCIVSPGFLDLQVYGSGGMLFGSYPNAKTLQIMEECLVSEGITGFHATLATNTFDVFEKGFQAASEHANSDQCIGNCLGVHLEGPFINKEKRGAHPEELIVNATTSNVKQLLSVSCGMLRMMTIAPELVGPEIREILIENDVVLSCGHSNASLEDGRTFFAENTSSTAVRAVTHLFNAMPPLYHRPGQVGYIPSIIEHRPYTSIVVDGIHVDFSMVKLAKKMLDEKLYLITDAVTEAREGVYQHKLHVSTHEISGRDIRKYVMPDGTLSGSALTMIEAIKNCVQCCDIPLYEAICMASLYPARLMGLESRKGAIEPGFDADICIFNNEYEVQATFLKGNCVFHRSNFAINNVNI